jgi:hypothetical protein
MDLDELGHVVPDAWPADASAAVGPALKPSERSSGPAVRIPEELEVAQSAKAPVSDRSCLILVVATTDNFVRNKKKQYYIYIYICYVSKYTR